MAWKMVALSDEQQDDRSQEGHGYDRAEQAAHHRENPQKTITTVPATTVYT